MIDNLYAKYLLADRLNKIAEKAGVRVDILKIQTGHGTTLNPDVSVQASAYDRREGETSNDAERAAERLLLAHPDLQLERTSGLVFLKGKQENGLTFHFYTGTGSCERVQVGTRIVPAQPEREEPIFETICPDPINDLLGV